ncbi:PX-domain-containing protein [Ascodesmis nigricans]|uniref:Endosomal/vacuolar adapter protein YPT35 n=1 Tax=Ascodesmis nigricans TaxID=341454 RepID=A0A4S2N3T4_9PEZI|nr:PX-domain-containing protein [Ascodesmis nigricans]
MTGPYRGRSGTVSSTSSSIISGELSYADPCPISLEDHTVAPTENSPGLWARSARVVDYAIVSGSRTRAGAYVIWSCAIETFEGASFTVRKRYSEFWQLREQLKATFPRSLEYLPQLPPKSTFSKFRPKFLESRRQGLSYFLSVVLLNPEFAGSAIVKNFLLPSYV